MGYDVLFVLAAFVAPAVVFASARVAVASPRRRPTAVPVLGIALLYALLYWSVSFPE